jgi:hypothetical protein
MERLRIRIPRVFPCSSEKCYEFVYSEHFDFCPKCLIRRLHVLGSGVYNTPESSPAVSSPDLRR